MRTTDVVLINALTSMLRSEGIDVLELDSHMSVLEGSISVLVPRRLMVSQRDLSRAQAIARQADLGDHLS